MFSLLRGLSDAFDRWFEPVHVIEEWDPSYPYPYDIDCPDTEPTSPGALDSDPERIK